MRLALALLLALGALPAAAEDLPAQFTVTGVAADDVLNIRAEPNAGAAILGALPPGMTDVEVIELAPGGRWGLVSTGEGNGWAAMRYLTRQEVPPGTVPRPLSCIGTEPFWGLFLDDGRVSFDTPDLGPRAMAVTGETVASNGYLVTLGDGSPHVHVLTVRRAACSDGMSDRRFGLQAMFHLADNAGGTVWAGCCTLDGG